MWGIFFMEFFRLHQNMMMWWDIVGCTNPFTTFRVKIKHDYQKLQGLGCFKYQLRNIIC